MAQYKDSVIQKYLNLVKANTTGIRGFFNGLVDKIPASMLPAILIDIEKTEATELSDVEDEHKISLVLVYIADIRQSFEDSALIVAGLNNVKEALIGRYDTGTPYALKTNSILYILRHNLNIDSANNLRTDVKGVSVVTPNEISSGRIKGFYTAEGNIRFSAHFIQER